MAKLEAEWINAGDTRAVMKALTANGGTARFVGGCVRNTLIGQAVEDVDIATPQRPDEVMARAEAAGLKSVPTGLKHGTVTLVAGGKGFEVTSLRRDVATDGRHAEVAFTDDWAEDARRRDFTMNAIYAEADGTLYDPLEGESDARAGRVRFVGEARSRIAEDYLRILRFFRFHAWYGSGAPDAEGLGACADLRFGLARLSAERVGKEIVKLLAAPDPRDAVAAMADAGVLAVALPGAEIHPAFNHTIAIELANRLNPGPMRRLVALHAEKVGGGGVEGLRDRLRLSNKKADHLAAVAGSLAGISTDLTGQQARALIYRRGRQVYRDAIVAAWAASGDSVGAKNWQDLLGHSAWDAPKFPVTGKDLEARGMAPGPEMGELLRALEEKWITSDFRLTREELVET